MPLPYDGFDEESQLVWHFTILQTDEPGMTCPGLLNGGLFYVSERGGKIVQLQLAAGGCVKSQEMRGLVGVLGGIAFDDRTGRFIVTDRASGLIMTLTGDASSKRPLIEPFPLSEQDSRRLKGPCDVTVATDGSIFFSDTGADGTHGIQNPRGSICRIAPAGTSVHWLLHECVAQPTSICASPNEPYIFVLEAAAQRILRIVHAPDGLYHTSVYAQLTGSRVASALACGPLGELYVVRHMFPAPPKNVTARETARRGAPADILVLGPSGSIFATLAAPGLHISGIVCAAVGDDYNLYITESTTGTLYKLSCQP